METTAPTLVAHFQRTRGSQPSQLFRKMYQLPLNAQLNLSSTADTLPLDQIAATADKISEVATPAPNVSALQQTTPPASVSAPHLAC